MENSPKCAHRRCDCLARKGSAYCSPACEAASETESPDCGCGHEACAANPESSEAARDADVDLAEIKREGRKQREKL